GWDDNGLPTERRVQNYFGVRCDPSLPYDPDFVPPEKPGKDQIPIGRRTFVELCEKLTAEDEQAFESVWRRLGLSVDWSQTYATIDGRSRTAAQRAFLRNLGRGDAYLAEAPTLWDITFRTAVAQAELEDRERPSAYHTIAFAPVDAAGGDPVIIETTRPELLPACVALVAHPDDERYQPLFGTSVRTPVFGVEVPVLAHRLADPAKGSGIAMVCTFGDLTDVLWWRELHLPTRSVVGRDGRLLADAPADITSPAGREAYGEIAGSTVFAARERVLAQLGDAGALRGEPRKIVHPVKFYERGERPLEIVTTRQWYVRNGGRDAQLRAELVARGRELTWHPPYMRARYENWVEGLTGDWLISRQRFFGIPFPVWYPLDAEGTPRHDAPITPAEDALPVDPSSDVPPGYTAEQRGVPGGFIGDPDVMDTWATSSLTPEIAGGWGADEELFAKVFPMDLRPQGHDIIRTWTFSTVLRSHLEFDSVPWTNVALSGWILDPERKKMSKSKGNVVTPMALLEAHGSDAVRYWAASGRPGTDTAFDEKNPQQMKIGRRLSIKILNVSKFVLGLGAADSRTVDPAAITQDLDKALLAALAEVVDGASGALDNYDYTRALEITESFFWRFCDDYVELVKGRFYGSAGEPDAASARATLAAALSVLLRLFAPVLPFVTEEVWSWWQEGSVHQARWPDAADVRKLADDGDPRLAEAVAVVITAVRRAKSAAKLSMKAEVAAVTVSGAPDTVALVERAAPDLRAAGGIQVLTFRPDAGDLAVAVDLAATTPA
ncbi:MAG: valine--tRNA ligase, partial [Frankia sp.]